MEKRLQSKQKFKTMKKEVKHLQKW